jgi:hypothetical protein
MGRAILPYYRPDGHGGVRQEPFRSGSGPINLAGRRIGRPPQSCPLPFGEATDFNHSALHSPIASVFSTKVPREGSFASIGRTSGGRSRRRAGKHDRIGSDRNRSMRPVAISVETPTAAPWAVPVRAIPEHAADRVFVVVAAIGNLDGRRPTPSA